MKKKEKPVTILNALTDTIDMLTTFGWYNTKAIKALKKHKAYLKREQSRKKKKKEFLPIGLPVNYPLTATFPTKRKEIVLNRAQCLNCKQVITSWHRHDFRTCKCGGLSVDGGTDYLKRSHSGPFKEMSVTR